MSHRISITIPDETNDVEYGDLPQVVDVRFDEAEFEEAINKSPNAAADLTMMGEFLSQFAGGWCPGSDAGRELRKDLIELGLALISAIEASDYPRNTPSTVSTYEECDALLTKMNGIVYLTPSDDVPVSKYDDADEE